MKIYKNTFFILIQFVVCAFILEITCHYFLLKSSNPLYRARRILQYDKTLGWMQKSDLTTIFEGQETNTDQYGFRIGPKNLEAPTKNVALLTLGPSSAFGWGVKNEETYTSLVASSLHIKALNASGIGHTIAQGQRMWLKIQQNVMPEYILIAYGVNDLDKFRFFDSDSLDDADFFKYGPIALKLDKLKLPSDFAVVASLVIRQASHSMKCDQLIKSPQRVVWNDYQKILKSIINEQRAKNIVPILVNTPFYLAHPKANFRKEEIESAYKEVSQLAVKGECKKAHEKLKIAKSLEPFNINYKVIEFNGLLKEFADKNKIKIIDAHSLLVNQNAKENFYDPVHPSVKGHQLIANEIVKVIQEKN